MDAARNTSGLIAGTDMPAQGWVDRLLPAALRPYAKLMRLDRPIGTWLLLWPGWWSLVWALDKAPATAREWLYLAWLYALFGVGAMVMRGAGCTYNDIVDRDFDAKVERTRTRPIPSGQVTVKGDLGNVDVYFKYPKGCNILDVLYAVNMSKEDGRWVIDDIRYISDNTSLVEDLKRTAY